MDDDRNDRIEEKERCIYASLDNIPYGNRLEISVYLFGLLH